MPVSDSSLIRPYRGVPAGDRVAMRREALIDAALEVFASEGWAALSARRICEQAGLTRRYFYESFEGLDGVLGAAFDRITGQVTQAVGEAVSAVIAHDAETPLPELVARAVSAGLEVVTTPPANGRFLAVAQTAGSSIAERRARSIDDLAALVEAVLSTVREGQPIGAQRARILAIATNGAMLRIIDAWLAGELELTKDEVVSWATTAAVGIIDAVITAPAQGSRGSA
jgi:AcrR family transcriptional regulator